MITKLDIVVILYLRKLGAPPPSQKDDSACAAYMDEIDRARFRVLDVLIRKPRYRRNCGQSSRGRAVWKSKRNPHRPPLA